MTMINIHGAKTHLSSLVEKVAAGERIVIAKAGRPMAMLTAYRPDPVVLGTLKGRLHYDSSTFDDFDPEIAALFQQESGEKSD